MKFPWTWENKVTGFFASDDVRERNANSLRWVFGEIEEQEEVEKYSKRELARLGSF